MPSHASLHLDWRSILPLNGSKQDAFEELCTQLARRATSGQGHFVRKGRPDAGVEAHLVRADGTEWAWQAKYFDAMKASQWSQLDESVKAALAGHPDLARFDVCVPVDLADGRSTGTTTARQQWDRRVAKWSGWARDAGMEVEFVWQGSHELLVELARNENTGLVNFFFGGRHLDDAWFRARLAEAHRAAGPRYTPELNIQLAINEKFDALGRTDRFLDGVRRLARPIRSRLLGHAFSLTRSPDASLQSRLEAARSACDRAMDEFRVLAAEPERPAPLQPLRDALREASHRTGDVLSEYRRQRDVTRAERERAGTASAPDDTDLSHVLGELYNELRTAFARVRELGDLAAADLIVLTGEGGSGKTHLLCDLARQRLEEGLPTVVLMGQRFLDITEPWTQALQQLDLAGWTTHNLVDALEIMAQRANRKVLLIIDALNEGAGRQLWRPHLNAFLDRLRGSAWISTVISVRSAYTESVLPEAIAEPTIRVEHPGFDGVEFDAARAFFKHFGIDVPSTPLLAPEFRNPLYLKILCRGLQTSGQTRLPRGFHGVLKTFDRYIAGINDRLAEELDYDKHHNLVATALRDLAVRMVNADEPWLAYAEAKAIVDAHLPGRAYSRSLMTKLVGEDVLIEVRAWSSTCRDMVCAVQIGYERMSDYLCAQQLVRQAQQRSRGVKVPDTAADRAVATLPDDQASHATWMRPGVQEALHILLAERTGRELIEWMPTIAEQHETPRIFLNSLIWRDPEAITPRAIAYLRDLRATHAADVVDTLVTLATVPDHPLNAVSTDQLLRESAMAERDAWWTVGLSGLWGGKGAVDRLIGWAADVWPHTTLGHDDAKLAATALAWLLSSSDRFLRDHATKALVSVLTWRPSVITELVASFCAVDDAYVVERTLAAAYGATMRTTDNAGVRAVAAATHAAVFAGGRPRPHVLLREYARGVIKRAEFLCIDARAPAWPNVDPPYSSDWPAIPTDDELDAAIPTWRAAESQAFGWAHHRIRSSVMDDDFARYIIGTNSWRTNWLSLRLDEAPWVPFELQVERAEAMLDATELDAWERYRELARAVRIDGFSRIARLPHGRAALVELSEDQQRYALEQRLNMLQDEVLSRLGPAKAQVLVPLMKEERAEVRRTEPRFDLRLVQRYVLGRVFEMGWTAERFGRFDQDIRGGGREADKPERIGKKYQWIAYHEMLAFMADHYQHVPDSRLPQVGAAFKGTWQEDVRDIDPSNVTRQPEHDEDEAQSRGGFWNVGGPRDWHRDSTARDWAGCPDEVPNPLDFLFSRDEDSRSDWVNLRTELKWSMPRPAYEDGFRDGRREIWMHADGALLPRAALGQLRDGRVAREILDRGTHGSSLYQIFLGEIGWSEASEFFHDPYHAHLGWAGEVRFAGLGAIPVAQAYSRERGGFDCSLSPSSISLRVPTQRLLELLEARWSGISATYVDAAGAVVAFDPSANVPSQPALLVRRGALRDALRNHDLAVCWAVQGEMTDASGSPEWTMHARRSFRGLFTWDGEAKSGRFVFDPVESPDCPEGS